MLRVMIFSLLLIKVAAGQTIFQPVEYEYRVGGTLYFYGGVNPQVHAVAAEQAGVTWGRHNGFAFAAAGVETGREVETERIRIFDDHFHRGLQDASVAGFTVADARNEAFANLPRYFRKADLIQQSVRVDGWNVVPPQAGSIAIRKSSGVIIPPPIARPLLTIPKADLHESDANIRVSLD